MYKSSFDLYKSYDIKDAYSMSPKKLSKGKEETRLSTLQFAT